MDFSESFKGMEFAFSVLSNLQNLWRELDLEGKRILIVLMILQPEQADYRTF